MLKVGDRVRVLSDAPFHQGKIGYIRGFGSYPSINSVILGEIPSRKPKLGKYIQDKLFIVDREHLVLDP